MAEKGKIKILPPSFGSAHTIHQEKRDPLQVCFYLTLDNSCLSTYSYPNQ